MRKTLTYLLITTLFATLLAGCSGDADKHDDDPASFSGSVLSLDLERQTLLIAVDTADQALFGDQASVSLDANVYIRDRQGQDLVFGDLAESDILKIKTTGAIRESYPVQVTALEIVRE